MTFGDRTLTVLLGQGGYHFITVDENAGNGNVN